MPLYRVYILNDAGHFASRIDLECASEQDAVKEAQQYVDGHDVELWDQNRFIAKISQNGV
jgi:hypothetical protein